VKEIYVKAGTHINAIGADAAGKQELESQLTKKSKIVIDNWEQASHSGEINVPLTAGIIGKKDIYGELGEIIIGKKRLRNQKDITIFDSTGLAIQDIACAAFIYKKVKSNKKLQKSLKRIKFLDK
jgi:alanine dehydrogenase